MAGLTTTGVGHNVAMQSIGDTSAPTLWEGKRHSLAGTASGGKLPTTRYRATAERLYWTTGRLGTKTHSVPMWAVRDAVVQQTITQRARRVGDVTVSLQHPNYSGLPTFVVLEDIEAPRDVARELGNAARRSRALHDEGHKTS